MRKVRGPPRTQEGWSGGQRAHVQSLGVQRPWLNPVPSDPALQRSQQVVVWEAQKIAGWNQTLAALTTKLKENLGPH